jgi:hypothetical protein
MIVRASSNMANASLVWHRLYLSVLALSVLWGVVIASVLGWEEYSWRRDKLEFRQKWLPYVRTGKTLVRDPDGKTIAVAPVDLHLYNDAAGYKQIELSEADFSARQINRRFAIEALQVLAVAITPALAWLALRRWWRWLRSPARGMAG